MIDINELRDRAATFGADYLTDEEWVEVIDRLEAAEQTAQDYLRIDGEKARIAQRLEAAEKAVTEAYQRGYATGQEEIEKERDALRTRIEAMERQRPVRFVFKSDELDEQIRLATDPIWAEAFEVPEGMVPLYALPGAQPAPSVPDHKTIRDLLNESGLCAYDREGDLAFMVAATKFAALAAAQEAKP